MATITLSYNEHNTDVLNAINTALQLGAKKVRTNARKSRLENAMHEVKRGDVIICNDFEDYLVKMNE